MAVVSRTTVHDEYMVDEQEKKKRREGALFFPFTFYHREGVQSICRTGATRADDQ